LFGGRNGERFLSAVYIYLPQEDRWIEGSSMQAPRAFAGAAVLGSRIHVVGGFDGERALKTHQAYIPSRDSAGESPWESYAPLTSGRYAMGTTHLVNTIYLSGGLSDGEKPAAPPVVQFILQANAWSPMEVPPTPTGALPGLIASGDFLYLMGGETDRGLSTGNQTYQAIYTISVPMLQSGSGE
jgi:N-acetylneuraminic acid mutarotase